LPPSLSLPYLSPSKFETKGLYTTSDAKEEDEDTYASPPPPEEKELRVAAGELSNGVSSFKF
jgi:hypothetical protein